MKRNVSKNFVNHIFTQGQSCRNKTIIIFHGWGSSVKNYDELAKFFSSIGFNVIVPEIIYHDSRQKLDNHFLSEITHQYFWKTIFRSIDESFILFEELGVSKKDVILMGISMGGFIANGIYAKGNNFAGLININGSGSFLLSEKNFRANDKRPDLSDEEINEINSYDPKGKIISNSSILLMHGELDTVVSIDGQKDYFKFLKGYDPLCDVVFNVYKNVNHSLTEEMIENLKQWLEEKHLVI